MRKNRRPPATHALTRVEDDQIRDWQVKAEGDRQILTVELIKPAEKSYSLTLFSEQTVEKTPFSGPLTLPQPLDIEREAGSLTLSTEAVARLAVAERHAVC